MAVSISSITTVTDAASTGTFSLTTSESPTATGVGDLVVVIHGNDFYAASQMGTPSATGSPTMTAVVTADGGANEAHIKAWYYYANTAGAQTITFSESAPNDEEKTGVAYVLRGAAGSSPIDDAQSNFNNTSSQPVCPAISPTNTDSFCIQAIQAGAGTASSSYTPPGGVTGQYDIRITTLMSAAGGTKQLTGSGSTGTFSWTAANNHTWASVTIGVKSAAGPAVNSGPWTGPTPGVLGPTGQWRVILGDATTPLNVYVPAEAAATGTAFDATVTVDFGNTAGPWTGPTPGLLGPTGRLVALLGDATTPLNVYVPDVPTGTGSAYDATIDAQFAADQTAGTGAAFDATPDVQVAADQTSGSAQAFDATVTIDYANYAGPWRDVTPGWISPTGHLNPLLGDATSSPDLFVNVPAEAGATAAAFDATVDAQFAADQSAGTGAAFDATPDVQVQADQTTAAASAFDASVTADYGNYAGPWTGPVPGRGSPTGQWTAPPTDPTAPGTVAADVAAAGGTAFDATIDVGIAADLAAGTGAALDAVLAVAAAVDVALGSGGALDAATSLGVPADQAVGTGSAFGAAGNVDYPVAGPWTLPTPGRLGPTGRWTIQPGIGPLAQSAGQISGSAIGLGGMEEAGAVSATESASSALSAGIQ